MTHSLHVNWAGAYTPTSETADVASAGRVEEKRRTGNDGSAAITAVAEAGRTFATLLAMAAMRRLELLIVSDGESGMAYLVRRWNLCRTLPNLAAVRAFEERAAIPHG